MHVCLAFGLTYDAYLRHAARYNLWHLLHQQEEIAREVKRIQETGGKLSRAQQDWYTEYEEYLSGGTDEDALRAFAGVVRGA